MSIHKLTAGSGYDYLTRQVAAQDTTELGHQGLAAYYTARGEAPGVWLGAGMTGLEGVAAGDPVTAEQMLNLFGSGHHPLAAQLRAQAALDGLDDRAQVRAAWLGSPYRVYANDVLPFRRLVAERVAVVNYERGLPADAPGSVDDRARVRTEVAVELFGAEFGRAPADAREVAATIARHSRPRTNAVAGYDLTFSPVKSVSTLWAVADTPVAAAVERAHHQAVKDALAYVERHALFTREGTDGVRQVETRGLIAAAFTHRDSRAGDPDLHTHVAVANKVQTRNDGKWLAIDGRLMFKATVAASETYNTRLEHHLRIALGVRFEARPDPDPRKRPVREIVGVDPALNRRWSSRRQSIEARRTVLAKAFQAAHGRPPSTVESIHLAQQATLETRDAKHPPRSLNEQRAAWSEQAADTLGGHRAVKAMIAATLAPTPPPSGWQGDRRGTRVDASWVRGTAAAIRDTLQGQRSSWQYWHVQAEALRQVRGADLATADIDRVVGLLVDEVLTHHSVPLTRPGDEVPVPASLRRSDGSSVYTVAGSALFTSAQLLAAEARIVARAGEYDGMRVQPDTVEVALLSCTANGLPLNAGQATLVREMATSGARVQLAIAPAGAGKTTAMRALAAAWVQGGGQVIGLAPSAAAAGVLGESIDAPTDTMAKLVWHLDHPGLGGLPAWAQQVGPATLVVVDEAGMADTLSLDAVVEFVVSRGGSVRLIGDDQQLAAVGAGGVLRDIQATHASLHLSELMRFADPAEGAASLALREGLPEALGFYLDRGRVHVGDLATLTDQVFTAWQADHATGRDAVMLAPTRDLVSELNQRARLHRLDTAADTSDSTANTPNTLDSAAGTSRPARAALAALAALPTVALADGNLASVGDLVITRTNDRTLRITATDWVKNGDRWRITTLGRGGSVTVQHARNGRLVTLPTGYVTASLELGYACTIHTAQGVTADTSHTLLTGQESRQLAYTAATRGRSANHLYLQVVGDGDEHNVIRPDHVHPRTATDLLARIVARDDSSRSASTMARDAADPAVLLGEAVARYVDSLHVAAEDLLGPAEVAHLEIAADRVVSDLTSAPAWPTLRAHLILSSAQGTDPVQELHTAATAREVDTADDPAAVIDWRLDDTGPRNAGVGPLPWLPGMPDALSEHPQWGPYLGARAARVRDLADQVGEQAAGVTALPGWARQGQGRPTAELLVDVAVWRAATGVDPADRRPTGPTQISHAAHRWQVSLTARLTGTRTPALTEWSPVFDRILTHPGRDPFTPLLAQRLSGISRAGLDAQPMLRRALSEGPLPDDHNAAALWWRITGRLTPAVAAHVESDPHLTTFWAERLPELVGADRAATLRESSWWPTLVTVVDHAVARGTSIDDLLTTYPHDPDDPEQDVDPCQAMVWRISVLTDPPPAPEDREDRQDGEDHEDWEGGRSWSPPGGLLEGKVNPFWGEVDDSHWTSTADDWSNLPPLDEPDDSAPEPPVGGEEEPEAPPVDDAQVSVVLFWAAQSREHAQPLPPTDRQIDAQLSWAHDADTATVSPERILQLNRLTLDYYTARFPGSWAQTYLAERIGFDLAGDPHVNPGYAPGGWTNLVEHLRRHGVTDLELTESGLATTTRTGRVIDRFRDRLVFPITTTTPATGDGRVDTLGFVGRRNPRLENNDAGPKYLNTPQTPLFHKGAQLFAVRGDLLAHGATPVLVEGPMDALAVSIAGRGRFVGLAPLGTSLTEEQAAQLATIAHAHKQSPLIATDADLPGQLAAQRDYWLLTQHGAQPQAVTMRPGSDPADILALHGPHLLRQVLESPTPLSHSLLTERLEHLTGIHAVREAIAVAAAGSPADWDDDANRISDATGVPAQVVRRELVATVQQWDHDPRPVVAAQAANLSEVRARMTAAASSESVAGRTISVRRNPTPIASVPSPPPPPQR